MMLVSAPASCLIDRSRLAVLKGSGDFASTTRENDLVHMACFLQGAQRVLRPPPVVVAVPSAARCLDEEQLRGPSVVD